MLDASLTLSWYFEDERTEAADDVLDRVVEGGAFVPALWRLDVANGLQVSVRRKRLNSAFRDSALTQLSRMPITVDPDTDAFTWTTTLQLADRFGLTLYAAAYLELAQRRRLSLATLDELLRTAARASRVDLLGKET